MTISRAQTTALGEFGARIRELAARITAIELVAHSHKTQASFLLPAGAVVEWIGTTAPDGFLLLDGSTITDGENIYPALWAVAPGGWQSGSDIVLPNDPPKMVRAF